MGSAAAIFCCVGATGCRVSPARLENVVDADFAGGDGLPARVIVDAWWWGAPSVGDGSGTENDTGRPAPTDGRADGADVADGLGLAVDSGSGSGSGSDAAPVSVECGLSDGTSCPVNQGCYPDEALSGGTSCRPATPGSGGGSRFPCQFQNDCSAGEICIDLKGNGRICLGLCRTDVDGPGGASLAISAAGCVDLAASACVPLPSYPGVGYCM